LPPLALELLRQTRILAARIGLSIRTHLAQLALFSDAFVRTFGRFDPVLKFTIRLRKQAHNFIEFRGGNRVVPPYSNWTFSPIRYRCHATRMLLPKLWPMHRRHIPTSPSFDGTIPLSSRRIARPTFRGTRGFVLSVHPAKMQPANSRYQGAAPWRCPSESCRPSSALPGAGRLAVVRWAQNTPDGADFASSAVLAFANALPGGVAFNFARRRLTSETTVASARS